MAVGKGEAKGWLDTARKDLRTKGNHMGTLGEVRADEGRGTRVSAQRDEAGAKQLTVNL